MAAERHVIDVSNNPALRKLVEETARTLQPKVLRVDASQAEVVLMPAKLRSRRPTLTPAKREDLLRATFGAWKSLIEPNQLKQELSELQRDETVRLGL